MFLFLKKQFLTIMLFVLFSILFLSCNSDDNNSGNDNSGNDNNKTNQSFVDTISVASNNKNGNFNVLNTTSDNIIIADSKDFFDSIFIKKISSGTSSVMINISNLGGVVRFFAIKEDVLRTYETTKDIPELEIITSIDFDTNYGGTWNPFGVPSTVSKKGAIFVNNYTDSILFVIPENQNNSPEGRINRGQKNVKVPFLIGTNFVYFVDVSTSNIIDYQEVFVSYQSSPYINVGKPDSYPVEPGILQISNNTNKIYTVQNMMTDQYLINNDCNCTDVGPSTTGIFEINPGVIQLLLTNSNNSSITSDSFNVSESQVVNLTIQNNAISINPIVNNAPTSSIIKPENDSSFTFNDNIVFEGFGNDLEDGFLESNSLTWSSNIDGEIGYGKTLIKNNLSTGTHLITLTARDSNKVEGVYMITIYISQNLPSSPLNLKAEPVNSDILITWNYVEAATSYKIYWSNESGVSKTNNSGFFSTELNSYNHHNLQNGIKYYYVVTSKNNIGESVESMEINAIPISYPSAPNNISIEPGDHIVKINWSSVDEVTSYNIYWSNSSNISLSNYSERLNTSSNSFSHYDLTSGMVYYYIITSKNENGESEISEIVSATPYSMPTSPMNVQAIPGNKEISLSWSKSTEVSHYFIYWSNNSGVSKSNYTEKLKSYSTTYNHKNIQFDKIYYYVITALNQYGESEVSSQVSCSPLPPDNQVDNYFLDLSEYTVGDIPNELGYSLLILKESGRKCISGLNGNGRIELSNLNLKENFELKIEVDFSNFSNAFILRSSNGNEVLVNFKDSNISYGFFSFNWGDTAWKGEKNINVCTFLMANGICKFLINNQYVGSFITDSSNIFNYFTITGIDEDDYIYAIEYKKINITDINMNDVIDRNNDQGFSLNLSFFEVGDLPTFLGSNILIHERNAKKHITSMPDSKANIIIDQITLQSNFELIYNADWTDSSIRVLLKSSNHDIEIYHGNRNITFGAKTVEWDTTGWKGNDSINECRLSVSNGTGKFYINNEFFGSIVVPQNEQYNSLYLSGIEHDDALFSLTGRNF